MMKYFWLICFYCIPLLSHGQNPAPPVCVGDTLDLSTLCDTGTCVVKGKIDLNKPGSYWLKRWCIENGDTLYKDSFIMTVDTFPKVIINPLPVLCQSDPYLRLYGQPSGGTFYCPDTQGVITGSQLSPIINPKFLKPGTYRIIYRYQKNFGAKCSSTDTAILTIKDCTWGEKYYSLCVDDSTRIKFSCDSGQTVTQGSVDYKAPGNYKVARRCIRDGDTLSKDTFFIKIRACSKKSYIMCKGDTSHSIIFSCAKGKSVSEGTVNFKEPGDYLVRHWCVDNGDTLSIDSVLIHVADLPDPSINSLPALCDDDPAFHLSQYGKPLDGVWYSKPNGFAVTNNYLFPSVIGPGVHWLTYGYTNPVTGCHNTDSAQITIKDCTSGIAESTGASFSIHPNPAKDYLILAGDFSKVTRITLTNALGEEKRMEIRDSRISLATVPPGLFFIHIQSGDKTSVLKGIKLP